MDDSTNTAKKTRQPAESPRVVKKPEVTNSTDRIDYTMPAKKGLSNKAIWGIVGGVIGLVILIVGVVLAVLFLGGPSKEDYHHASKIMSDFNSREILGNINRETDVESAKEEINKGIAKVDAYYEKLGNTRAMRDKDVKEKFDKYFNEYKDIKPTIQGVAESLPYLKTFRKDCNSGRYISSLDKGADQVAKEFDELNGKCIESLEKMKQAKDKGIAEFADEQLKYLSSLKKYYMDRADYYSKRDSSVKKPEYPDYPRLSNPMRDSQEKISKSKISDYEKELYNLLRDKSK